MKTMEKALSAALGTRFMTQPIDIPVALLNVLFVISAASTVLLLVANVALLLGGVEPVPETVAPFLWTAMLSAAMRDGIADGHRRLDARRVSMR